MWPSAGTRTTSKPAVFRPCWKFRVESTGRSPSGYAWSQPLPLGWNAITLRATADTWPGAGTPLAPVTRNEVIPPAGTATLPTTVAGGTGVKVPPSPV